MTEDLRQTLDQLHEQLESGESLNAEIVDRLKSTIGEIRETLEEHGIEGEHPPTVTERLEEAASEFELSHPTISGTITRLIDLLGQMGI